MADKPRAKFYWRFFHALCAVVILAFSSIPFTGSQEEPSLVSDKLIHFTEYGIFGFLGGLAYLETRRGLVLLLVFGAAFAGLDEFWQSFVPGRNSDLYDFWADQAGHVLGALIGFWMAKRRR